MVTLTKKGEYFESGFLASLEKFVLNTFSSLNFASSFFFLSYLKQFLNQTQIFRHWTNRLYIIILLLLYNTTYFSSSNNSIYIYFFFSFFYTCYWRKLSEHKNLVVITKVTHPKYFFETKLCKPSIWQKMILFCLLTGFTWYFIGSNDWKPLFKRSDSMLQ